MRLAGLPEPLQLLVSLVDLPSVIALEGSAVAPRLVDEHLEVRRIVEELACQRHIGLVRLGMGPGCTRPVGVANVVKQHHANTAFDERLYKLVVKSRVVRSAFLEVQAWGWKLCRGGEGETKQVWRKGSEEALEPIGLHEARDTFVRYAVAAGLDSRELVEVVGHSDIRTTLNIYAHLFADSHSKMAAKLDAYLGQTGAHA